MTKFSQTSGGNVAAIHSIQLRWVGSSSVPMSSRCVQRITPGGMSSVASSSATSIDERPGTKCFALSIINSNFRLWHSLPRMSSGNLSSR